MYDTLAARAAEEAAAALSRRRRSNADAGSLDDDNEDDDDDEDDNDDNDEDDEREIGARVDSDQSSSDEPRSTLDALRLDVLLHHPNNPLKVVFE